MGEQELAFTLMTSLTDDLKRDSVRLLLRDLANAIDEGKASYAQLMVKVIVDTSVADGIAEDIRAAGSTPTMKRSDSRDGATPHLTVVPAALRFIERAPDHLAVREVLRSGTRRVQGGSKSRALRHCDGATGAVNAP